MDTDFLDWALAEFSGYVAADELYDGPFCMLSAVDNRCYKRLLYDVLDHDPTHDDIRAFLKRLKTALSARDLTLVGITTDGSALYPAPLAELFSGVPHQICTFHVLAEVVKAVLGAVARARKSLAAKQPTLPKGRPSTQVAKAAARKKKRLAQQRAALFSSREQNRTEDPVARQPWVTPVTGAACDHGAGVCVMRSALSDPDGPRQAGATASSSLALPTAGRYTQEALFPYLGKGPDVSRREAAALHLACRGAG